MDLISQKLTGLSDSELMETEQDSSHFLDTKIRLKLGMARAAQEQNNFNLTLKILKQTHKVSHIKSCTFFLISVSVLHVCFWALFVSFVIEIVSETELYVKNIE